MDRPVLAEMRLGEKAHPALRVWADSTAPATVHLSVATLLELAARVHAGAASNPEQAAALSAWLTGAVLPAFGSRMVAVDAVVALEAGTLASSGGLPSDVLLAATARAHKMVVASNRQAVLQPLGVTVFDPWSGKTYLPAKERT